jgi:hypothetical protein
VAPVRAHAGNLADLGSSATSVRKGKKMADRFAKKKYERENHVPE